MSFLNEQEREVLLLEYETLHKENWERGQNVWVVNSILITGSLIVSFQLQIKEFPAPLMSLFLVIIAAMLEATSDKVTTITYRRMERIRELLGMTGPTIMYHTEIRGKWWYMIRKNLSYFLYLILTCIYLFLFLHDKYFSLIIFVTGVVLIIAKELYYLIIDRN
jgi:hypothetical protein